VIDLIAIALQTAQAEPAPADPVWVAYFKVHAKDLEDSEIAIAQRYASCMSLPYFPLPDQLPAKRDKCRSAVQGEPSKQLTKVLENLDSIVREYPASEASLSVTKDSR
jgi:hypothetical protein